MSSHSPAARDVCTSAINCARLCEAIYSVDKQEAGNAITLASSQQCSEFNVHMADLHLVSTLGNSRQYALYEWINTKGGRQHVLVFAGSGNAFRSIRDLTGSTTSVGYDDAKAIVNGPCWEIFKEGKHHFDDMVRSLPEGKTPLVVTGHGIGGSRALLFAYWMWAKQSSSDLQSKISVQDVYMFGAPPPFSSYPNGFAEAYRSHVYNIVQGFDWVPRLLGEGSKFRMPDFFKNHSDRLVSHYPKLDARDADAGMDKSAVQGAISEYVAKVHVSEYKPFGRHLFCRLNDNVLEYFEWAVAFDKLSEMKKVKEAARPFQHHLVEKYVEALQRSLQRLDHHDNPKKHDRGKFWGIFHHK